MPPAAISSSTWPPASKPCNAPPTALAQLRSNTIYDVEFVDGRDGGDVATFLDDSVRYARAAYAIVHTVIDKEAP